MRNNLRSLFSVPAVAIAAMAVTATSVNAQCPGGCFGYPTPSQPAFRSYAPAVQYRSVRVAPVQTFVQPQSFPAPEFFPVQNFAQPQSFVQPQSFASPQQFAPAVPIQQTFVNQPAMFESAPIFESAPMLESAPITGVPQYSTPATYPALPADAYNVQSGVIEQPMLPMNGQPTVPPVTMPVDSAPVDMIPPATMPQDADASEAMKEAAKDRQVEGEIISANDSATDSSVLEKDNGGDVPLTATPGSNSREAAGIAATEKAAMEKAAMEKAAMEKAEMKKAEMEKAEMKKAEMEKAANKKAKTKELTNEEKIAKLETSLKRQVKRAEQVSKRELSKKLKELEGDDASFATIEAVEQASSDALEQKLDVINKRIQARIEQLKE